MIYQSLVDFFYPDRLCADPKSFLYHSIIVGLSGYVCDYLAEVFISKPNVVTWYLARSPVLHEAGFVENHYI